MTAVAAYAVSQRNRAEEKTAEAEEQTQKAGQAQARAEASEQKTQKALTNVTKAERATQDALDRLKVQNKTTASALEATQEANERTREALVLANDETTRADKAADRAEASLASESAALERLRREQKNTKNALTAVQKQKKRADASRMQAEEATIRAQVGRLVASSSAALPKEPVFALQDALAAAALLPRLRPAPSTERAVSGRRAAESTEPDQRAEVEDALRHALAALRVTRIFEGGGPLTGAYLSPNGRLVVTAGVAGVRIHDAATGRRAQTLEHGSATVNQAVFSDDGSLLATAATDGRARIWNVASGGRSSVSSHTADRSSRSRSRETGATS
jgi:hypothetical protein